MARLAHFTDKVRAELQVRHMWEAVVLIVLRVLRVDFAVQIVRANVWRKHSAASVHARQRQRGGRERHPLVTLCAPTNVTNVEPVYRRG